VTTHFRTLALKALSGVALLALTLIAALTLGSPVAGQGAPAAPAAPAQGAGGRGAPPPPPEPQAGHPSGKLIIAGDLVNFERPGTPLRCIGQTRYKRGGRVGFRMTAFDGGSGEIENTAVIVVHLSYGGQTLDIPMRWRGNAPFPKQEYLRAPVEMWTGVWTVPMDAPIGSLSYTVTATDRFGRTATWTPFPNTESQLHIAAE
jgi:hypothetical protein